MSACCEKVYSGNGWHITSKVCGKPGKVEVDGKHYCGIHDPIKKAAKRKERDAEWEANRERRRAESRLQDAAHDLLAAAQQALEVFELQGNTHPLTAEAARALKAAIAKAVGP